MSNEVTNNESEGNTVANVNVNDILAQMAKLTAQLAEQTQRAEKAEKVAAAVKKGHPFMKVSEKKALSLYRINTRFPITLYKNQWLKVLDMAEEIRKFITDNDKLLSDPPESKTEPKGSVNVTDPEAQQTAPH